MLAKHLADRAYRNRTNAIWDITMNSPDSVTEQIVAMRTAGYIEVDGVFANVPLDIARMRAMHRWRQGQETYRAGTGCGGRYVPEDFIDASTPDVPGFSSRNEEVFEMGQRPVRLNGRRRHLGPGTVRNLRDRATMGSPP